jgi:predicted ATPase
MRIKQLKIEGFRSLKNVTWEPGDLNILIGPNGTGKSNLLRFLELITVTAKGGLGKYIQSLGGMDALIWDGRASEVSFTLDCMNEGIVTPNFYALNLNPILSSYSIVSEILIAKKTHELFI